MTDALSIALSGLNAQKQRLAASASNIANVSTAGPVPQGNVPPAPAGAAAVYKPLTVSLQSQEGGGVQAAVVEKQNPYSISYDPSSAYANAEGYIAVPNVDLAEEVVNVMQTKNLFKANLAVIKTQDEMTGDLLDTLA